MSSEAFQKLRNSLDKDHKAVLDRFLKTYCEECEKDVRNQIEIDKRHVAIVNLVAYAFSESGPLRVSGYHFVLTEPLFRYRRERGNKIFDLVLYNETTKRAILIEVKSSIEDPRRDVLNPLKDQIQNAQNHKRELEEEIGGEIVDMEYVVCGPPQDIEEVGKKLKDDDPCCLWSADIQYSTLKIYNPSGSTDPEKTKELIRRRQLNLDASIRETMYSKTKSSGQVGIRILTTSHVCRILSRTIVGIIQKFLTGTSAQERRFWRREIRETLTEDLPRIPPEDLDRIIDELIQLAIRIKIVETEESLSKEVSYKLKVGTRTAKTIEDFVEGQYIKQNCEEKSPGRAIEKYGEYVKKDAGSLDFIFDSLKKSSTDGTAPPRD